MAVRGWRRGIVGAVFVLCVGSVLVLAAFVVSLEAIGAAAEAALPALNELASRAGADPRAVEAAGAAVAWIDRGC